METPAQNQNPATQDFDLVSVLNQIDEGNFMTELKETVQAVVGAVHTLGKDGKITITLDVCHAGRTVEITHDIRPKEPKATKSATIFFVTERGGLTRKDPKQMALPFAAPGAPITAEQLRQAAQG